jgi:hypothetical protein
VTTSFENLADFQSYFRGWLSKNPVINRPTLPARMNYSHADSTLVYLAEHPRYIGIAEQLRVFHPQISDKAFEEKAIKAIERHLSLCGDIWQSVAKDPLDPTAGDTSLERPILRNGMASGKTPRGVSISYRRSILLMV